MISICELEERMMKKGLLLLFVFSISTIYLKAEQDGLRVSMNGLNDKKIIEVFSNQSVLNIAGKVLSSDILLGQNLVEDSNDLNIPIIDPIFSRPKLSSTKSYLNEIPTLVPEFQRNSLTYITSFHQNSNSLPLGFVMKFLAKGEINSAYKDRITNFPGKRIRYEDELKAGLSYQHYFSKHKMVFYASYFHRNMRYADITKDALNLVLYGNKMYEDKTASLEQYEF